MTGPAAALEEHLAAAGFLCLGGFAPRAGDRVPPLPGGSQPGGLYLIGSTGPGLWPHLISSPEFADGLRDPMDRYTRRFLSTLASQTGFEPVFPFEGPPYHPFQQWAMKCGSFSQSPIGVLAHRTYGVWAGFRAVFLSPDAFEDAAPPDTHGPCGSCAAKPCLTACPVGAFSIDTGYDVPKCRTHLKSDRTRPCWSGCLARTSCPVGQEHRPAPETAGFHMESFLGI